MIKTLYSQRMALLSILTGLLLPTPAIPAKRTRTRYLPNSRGMRLAQDSMIAQNIFAFQDRQANSTLDTQAPSASPRVSNSTNTASNSTNTTTGESNSTTVDTLFPTASPKPVNTTNSTTGVSNSTKDTYAPSESPVPTNVTTVKPTRRPSPNATSKPSPRPTPQSRLPDSVFSPPSPNGTSIGATPTSTVIIPPPRESPTTSIVQSILNLKKTKKKKAKGMKCAKLNKSKGPKSKGPSSKYKTKRPTSSQTTLRTRRLNGVSHSPTPKSKKSKSCKVGSGIKAKGMKCSKLNKSKSPSIKSSKTKGPSPRTRRLNGVSHAPTPKSKKSKSCKASSAPAPGITPVDGSAPGTTPVDGSDGSPTSLDRCEQIKGKGGPKSSRASDYSVNYILILNDSNTTAALQRLEDFLQSKVAPLLSGCSASSRRLLSSDVVNVEFDVYEDGSMPSCSSSMSNTTCHHVDANATVYYEDGSTTTLTNDDLYNFLITFCEEMKDIEGIEKTFDPCEAMQIFTNSPGGGSVSAVQQNPTVTSKISPGAVVGVVLAALVALILVLFTIRERQKNDYLSKHHQLDEHDDSTYLKDDFDGSVHNSSDGGLSSPVSLTDRKHHVLGEDDSLLSGWTGISRDPNRYHEDEGPRLRSFNELDVPSDRHVHGDVHVCSSATCEICERRRQAGVQFVPTGLNSYSHESLPSDGSREYMATDTVHL